MPPTTTLPSDTETIATRAVPTSTPEDRLPAHAPRAAKLAAAKSSTRHALVFSLALTLATPLAAAAAQDGTTEASQAPQPAACTTPVEERNRRLFQSYLEALTGGDIERAYSFWAEGATVTIHGTLPYAGTYAANDPAYGAMLSTYWERNLGSAGDPTLYADCDRIILVGRWRATARPTGIPVDQTIFEFFTFNRQGKMTRDDFYFEDTAVIDAVLTP